MWSLTEQHSINLCSFQHALFSFLFILWARVPLPLNCWIGKRMSGIAFIYEIQPLEKTWNVRVSVPVFFVASSSIEIHSTFGHKRAPTRKKNQRKFPIYTESDIMSHWMWYEKSYNDACHWFRTAGKKTNWSEKRNLWLIILANDGLAFFCSVAQRPHRACISEVLIEFNRHFLWPWDVRYLMSHRTMDIEYSCNGMQSLFFSHSHNRPYGEESVSVIVCEPMHYRLEF